MADGGDDGPLTPRRAPVIESGSTPPPPRPLSARRAGCNLKINLTVPQPESPPIRSVAAAGAASPRQDVVSPAARSARFADGAWANIPVTPTSNPVTPSRGALRSPRQFTTTGASATVLSPPVSASASAMLSPQPIAIDMPSPSFDPLLEHFLRPLESSTAPVACLLERAARGKAFRMLVEEGNVLLLVAERRYRDFELSAADGTRVATLHRVRKGHFVLRRANPDVADPELAAIVLGDREVARAPSRPRLNHMRLAAVRPEPSLAQLMEQATLADRGHPIDAPAGGAAGGGAAGGGRPLTPRTAVDGGAAYGFAAAAAVAESPVYGRLMGRPAGELLAALAADAPPAHPTLLVLESRLPSWDEPQQLLTLDYPPGRASLASVQNFQLLPPPPVGGGAAGSATGGGGGGGRAIDGCCQQEDMCTEPDDAAFCAALVHGMIRETEALDTFSLDFRHPLSSLLAFAVCLAAQDWE